MKKKLARWLLAMSRKLDSSYVMSCNVGMEHTIGLKTIIPADGKWYFMEIEFNCWIRNEGDGKDKVAHVETYCDGKLASKFDLSEAE